MKYLAMIAVILVAGSIGGRAVASSAESSFATQVQQDLLGQYALAVLARNHASSPTAKSLAKNVASNAMAANAWLKSYAASHHLSLTDKPSTFADVQYGELQGAKGASFDKLFGQDLIVDSEVRLGTLRSEAAKPTALGRFAKKQLAAMEKFSKEAHGLAK